MKRSAVIMLQPIFLCAAGAALAVAPDDDHLTLQKQKSHEISNTTNVLRDIHGPLPIADYPPYLVESVILLLILLLLALLFLFFRKRKKNPQPPPVPPWERALMELVEARQLMSNGQSLLYMERASQILRRYIELLFAIPSTRKTTHEFLAGLKDSEHAPLLKYRAELRACLEQADMAKFAHLIADQRHMEKMEEAVRTFISSTRPEEHSPGERP